MLSSRLLLELLLLAAPLTAAEADDSGPVVQIDAGKVKGVASQSHGATVNKFLGIPYAEPPLNQLRFATPESIKPWNGTLNALHQPNACIQYYGAKGPARDMTVRLYDTPAPPGQSEDCLYLNVYVPEGGEKNKSVLFWIHGGSGVQGAASLPLYDGTSFAARQDLIVVAINYRLNVFGAPGIPTISNDKSNLYQLDIRLALDWTARNIEAFGGDPTKVTIMGESSGAISVGNLVNTMPDNPQFRAAIEMSGSSVAAPQNIENKGDDEQQWPQLMKLLNCTNTAPEKELQCARNIDAKTIQNTMETNKLSILVTRPDNKTVLEKPGVAWSKGRVAKVPLLIGSTADDASYFTHQALAPFAGVDVTVKTVLEKFLGLDSAAATLLSEKYKPGSIFAEGANTTEAILSRIATDITFRCTSGFVANLTSKLEVPVWQYLFDAKVPSNTWKQWPFLGVYHASELGVLFGTYNQSSATEDALSLSMQSKFGDFIKNPEQGPGWAKWPSVGILGVDQHGAALHAKPSKELDAVCQLYYPLYLKQLPQLAALPNSTSPAGNDSGKPGSSTGPPTAAAGTHLAPGCFAFITFVLACLFSI